jgi:serine protease Do
MLSLYRGGSLREMQVVVGEWQDDAARRSRRAERASPAPNKLGLALAVPNATQRRERNVDHGLLVERVQGAAARADLQVGDLILAMVVGGRQIPLKTLETYNRQVADLKDGQTVTLLVQRSEGASYVSLRAGE